MEAPTSLPFLGESLTPDAANHGVWGDPFLGAEARQLFYAFTKSRFSFQGLPKGCFVYMDEITGRIFSRFQWEMKFTTHLCYQN
jgi:hypothetical protein